MNTVLRSVFISYVASEAVVVVQKQFNWQWNMENVGAVNLYFLYIGLLELVLSALVKF